MRYDGLHERKRQLKAIITKRIHLLYCDHIEQHGERLFEIAYVNDLEGIVAKPKNSPYQFTEKHTYWLKLKNPNYTQAMGCDDLFAPAGKKGPNPTGPAARLLVLNWRCEIKSPYNSDAEYCVLSILEQLGYARISENLLRHEHRNPGLLAANIAERLQLRLEISKHEGLTIYTFTRIG